VERLKLSRIERIILANQMQILQAVGPKGERDYFAHAEEALRMGYEYEYDDLFQSVYAEGLTEDECREVWDTLAMHDWLRTSCEKLADKTDIDEYDLSFHGYDGNNETLFMTYLEYVVEKKNRFVDLVKNREFNSHSQVRDAYQRMLRKFDQITSGRRGQLLTKREIQEIVYERVHPENRQNYPPPWEKSKDKPN
jgi:uncharacterized protein YfbU (UPF0304 family)